MRLDFFRGRDGVLEALAQLSRVGGAAWTVGAHAATACTASGNGAAAGSALAVLADDFRGDPVTGPRAAQLFEGHHDRPDGDQHEYGDQAPNDTLERLVVGKRAVRAREPQQQCHQHQSEQREKGTAFRIASMSARPAMDDFHAPVACPVCRLAGGEKARLECAFAGSLDARAVFYDTAKQVCDLQCTGP